MMPPGRRRQPPIIGATGFDGGHRPAIAIDFPPKRPRPPIAREYCDVSAVNVVISGAAAHSDTSFLCGEGVSPTMIKSHALDGSHTLHKADGFFLIIPDGLTLASYDSEECDFFDDAVTEDLFLTFVCDNTDHDGHLSFSAFGYTSGHPVFASNDYTDYPIITPFYFNFGEAADNGLVHGGTLTPSGIGGTVTITPSA